jgi:hypothetical protein
MVRTGIARSIAKDWSDGAHGHRAQASRTGIAWFLIAKARRREGREEDFLDPFMLVANPGVEIASDLVVQAGTWVTFWTGHIGDTQTGHMGDI